MKRRTFLKSSAVLAAPLFIPRHVLGAASAPGANDQIGVGYIGCGRRAAQLMGLPAEGRHVAFADAYLPRAEAAAKKYGAAKATQHYEEVLDMPEVDAIVTATPDHWRAIVCIHACQAGKDIYAEKPMTLTIHEGRQIVKAVRKHDVVFQTGSQQRSMPTNRRGCELIRNGALGKISKVIAHNYPSPWICDLPGEAAPEGLDWNMWCGPVEPVPYHHDIFTPRANPGWISFHRFSGGESTGWGSHGFDQIQWALGMDDTGPVEIWTEKGTFNPPTYSQPESRDRGNDLCDEPVVKFRYANGIEVELGKEGPGGGGKFYGEKGTMTLDRGRFVCDPPELAEMTTPDDGVHLYESNNHMQNWFDCMKSRKTPVCDVEIGHRSGTICHLVNIARWTGRRLEWDPSAERFVGDDQANAHLDRERRKGYELPTV